MNKVSCVLILLVFKLNISNAQERAIPECIEYQIKDTLQLKIKEIKSIKEVLIKDRYLYVFDSHDKQARGFSSYKKPSSTVYYDSICNVATVLTIGGIVGIKATSGFKVADFQKIKHTRILWEDKKIRN